MNIAIMRTFTKLRKFLTFENQLEKRVTEIEKGTDKLFKIVFERLDGHEEQLNPQTSPKRKKIGLNPNDS